MELLVKDAQLLISRHFFLPQIIFGNDELHPWFRDLISKFHQNTSSYVPDVYGFIEEDELARLENFNWERKLLIPCVVGFLPDFGQILTFLLQDQLYGNTSHLLNGLEATHSRRHYRLLDVPSNWKVKCSSKHSDLAISISLRAHIYQSGGAGVILSCYLKSQQGIPIGEFIKFVNSFDVTKGNPSRITCSVNKKSGQVECDPKELLNLASERVTSAMFKHPAEDFSGVRSIPDHVFVDIFRTEPILNPETNEKQIQGILRGVPDFTRLTQNDSSFRGVFEDDFLSFNKTKFVFSQNMEKWVDEKRMRRSLLQRRRTTWHFFKVVEFCRFEQTALSHYADYLTRLALEIHEAKNEDRKFVKTLLKVNYFDADIVKFCLDLLTMSTHIYGGLGKVYGQLSEYYGIPAERERLSSSLKEVLQLNEKWEPGLKRFFGLLTTSRPKP